MAMGKFEDKIKNTTLTSKTQVYESLVEVAFLFLYEYAILFYGPNLTGRPKNKLGIGGDTLF